MVFSKNGKKIIIINFGIFFFSLCVFNFWYICIFIDFFFYLRKIIFMGDKKKLFMIGVILFIFYFCRY